MSYSKKILLTILILFIIWIIGVKFLLNRIHKQIPIAFSGYDTSIVYHNGKWDTTIVKKQIPSWLR